MLKIFISSTSRDLKDFRRHLLDELNTSLNSIGMEDFIPDGSNSQEICINRLKDSDIVIFLLTPYYGSLINKCSLLNECMVECPMKTSENRISYTHCEYKNTLAEDKPHQTYLISEGWDELCNIKDTPDNEIIIDKLRKKPFFSEMSDDLINHYIKIRNAAYQFQQEVGKEYYFQIDDLSDPKNIKLIKNQLAENIVKWHRNGKLKFKDFCDRKIELQDLVDHIDNGVEIYGVGGVGKTSLVQVALLIQKLKGKQIITIGSKQAYAEGSGYNYFRKKCREYHHKVTGDKITLDDIIDALESVVFDVSEIRKMMKDDKITAISDLIEKKEIILFIDDFHLAEEDLKELILSTEPIIISSRIATGLTYSEICLMGIEENERDNLINVLSLRYKVKLRKDIKEKIKNITEGHPVSTELFIKNYQKINFNKLHAFKDGLEFWRQRDLDMFLERLVKEILSESNFAFLKDLSIINTDLDTNLDLEALRSLIDEERFIQAFNELIDTGMWMKKENTEDLYQFSFKHIQDAIKEENNRNSHQRAIRYYERKKEIGHTNVNDEVELLYHEVKFDLSDDCFEKFLELKEKILPRHYGFRRLISIGDILINLFEGEKKAIILKTIGFLFNLLRRFEASQKKYSKALEIFKELHKINPRDYIRDIGVIHHQLALAYFHLGRYNLANENDKIALDYIKKVEDSSLECDILWHIGYLNRFRGKKEKALTYLKEADEICDKLNDLIKKSKILYTRAMIAYGSGNFLAARNFFAKALEIVKMNNLYQEVGDRVFDIIRVYGDLAYQGQDFDLAGKIWSLMKTKAKELNDMFAYNCSIARLTLIEESCDLDFMKVAWNGWLRENQLSSERASELTAYGELAEVYIRRGELEEAINLCEKAEPIFEVISNLHTKGGIAYVRGIKSIAKGEIELAKHQLQEAENYFKEWTSPYQFWISNTLKRLNAWIKK